MDFPVPANLDPASADVLAAGQKIQADARAIIEKARAQLESLYEDNRKTLAAAIATSQAGF